MFTLRRLAALFRPGSLPPYESALRALALGQADRALRILDSLRADPGLTAAERAAIANKRGVAFVRLERRAEAELAFEDALGIVSNYPPALVNLGNLRLESGDLEGAVLRFQQAVASDENYGPAHHNLGVAYKRMGRTADAVRELKRGQRLEGRPTASLRTTSPNRRS